jgi:nitrate reductase gamma subunit
MGIAITGMHMRLVLDPDQHAVRTFLQSLFTFSWKPTPESAGISFIYHFALVQLLMVYFPFSKLMHTVGSVFSKMVARS